MTRHKYVNSHSVEEVDDVDLDEFSLILKDKGELYTGDYKDLLMDGSAW